MRSAERGTLRRIALAGALLLVLSAATVIGFDATGHLPGGLFDDVPTRPSATPTATPTRTPAGPVLSPAARPTLADGATPVVALERLLRDDSVGQEPGAFVVDAHTGDTVVDHDSATPRTPASLAKLATGAAALVALGPDTRLTTRVVAGATPDEVVLVGGGDASLTVRRSDARAAYPRRASLADLATATAARLRADGVASVSVRVDDSLFTGPAVSPDWEASYVGSGVVSPVHALSVDSGRVRPGSDERERDPALAAGQELARLLGREGVAVNGEVGRATAGAGAAELAVVHSPTVGQLIEAMFAESDNDLAEALLRLVGRARSEPASFAGGTAAVSAVLDELGVPTTGLRLLDGSGLARDNRAAPDTLGSLLALAAGPDRPDLRPLVTGLPVAAFSGTLTDRFDTGSAEDAAGLVRAKTGTLTGVTGLAGVAEDPTGRLLAFALIADDVPPADTLGARSALDRFAAALTVPESWSARRD